MARPYVRLMSVLIEAGQKNAVKPAEIAARIAERDDRQATDGETKMKHARLYPLEIEKVLKAVNLSAPELRLLVSNYY